MVFSYDTMPLPDPQDSQQSKCCKTCKETKPLSFFFRNHLSKDKHASSCKTCQKEYDKLYHIANKTKHNKQSIAYYEAHKEHLDNINRENYERKKEEINAAARLKRKENPELVRLAEKTSRDKRRTQIRLQEKLRRKKNAAIAEELQNRFKDIPKKCGACQEIKPRSAFHKDAGNFDGYAGYCADCQHIKAQAYYEKNSGKIIARTKTYVENHKEQLREWGCLRQHRRRARKLSMPDTFTKEDQDFCLRYWKNSCAVCGRQDGLWYLLALDHFVPMKSPLCPGTTAQNIIVLCHGKRGKPADMVKCCNQTKQAKDPVLWLHEYFTAKHGPKLGPRRAKAKLREINAYFAIVQERTTPCLTA